MIAQIRQVSSGEAVGVKSSAVVFRRSSADLPRFFRGASETTSAANENNKLMTPYTETATLLKG